MATDDLCILSQGGNAEQSYYPGELPRRLKSHSLGRKEVIPLDLFRQRASQNPPITPDAKASARTSGAGKPVVCHFLTNGRFLFHPYLPTAPFLYLCLCFLFYVGWGIFAMIPQSQKNILFFLIDLLPIFINPNTYIYSAPPSHYF